MQEKNNHTQEFDITSSIDITKDTCPMTFVKTKIRLEKMKTGEILEVILRNGEPLRNVPLSAKELGHELLVVEKYENDEIYKLLIKVK